MKLRIKVMQKLLTMSLIPCLFTGIGLAALTTTTLETEITTEVEEVLHSTALGLSETIDISNLDSYQDLLDTYRDELQIDTTIFIGDVRELTTVEGSLGTTADPTIYSHVKQGDHYFSTNANVNGVEYFGYYIPLYDESKNFIGMTFAGKPTASMNEALRVIASKFIFVVAGIVLILGVIVLIQVRSMVKQLKKSGEIVELVANGNLNVDTDISFSNDEIGDIGRQTVSLVEKLRSSVGDISKATDALGKMAANLSEAAKVSSEYTDDISKAVGDVATGASSQAEETEKGANNMSNVNEEIMTIRDQSKVLVEIGEGMRVVENTVMEKITSSIALNQKTNDGLTVVDDKVKRTSDSIDNIKKAMEIIKDIADQTQLLSLNASIEAAHAGDAGKGFAVVATSVGQLASESKEASATIEKILSDLLSDYDGMKKALESLMIDILQQSDNIEDTSKQFEELDNNIGKVVEYIGEIEKSVEDVQRLSDSVMDVISNLSAISQENAASAEETTARTEELNMNINKVSSDANELNDISNALVEAVKFFKN